MSGILSEGNGDKKRRRRAICRNLSAVINEGKKGVDEVTIKEAKRLIWS